MGAGNTLPRRLPRHPKIVGQVPPRTARPEPPRDRLKDLAVITPPTATLALGGRQNRLHHNPKLIRDHTSTSHHPIITDQTAHIWETRPRHRCPACGHQWTNFVAVWSRGALGRDYVPFAYYVPPQPSDRDEGAVRHAYPHCRISRGNAEKGREVRNQTAKAAVLVAAGALVLAACGTNKTETPQAGGGGPAACDTSKGTLIVGVIAPLSASLSALGLGIKNSADLAVKQANDK